MGSENTHKVGLCAHTVVDIGQFVEACFCPKVKCKQEYLKVTSWVTIMRSKSHYIMRCKNCVAWYKVMFWDLNIAIYKNRAALHDSKVTVEM